MIVKDLVLLAPSYVIFLRRRAYALVTALWIEDLSGYWHRKTAISTEFSQLRSTATGSYSNFGLNDDGLCTQMLRFGTRGSRLHTTSSGVGARYVTCAESQREL